MKNFAIITIQIGILILTIAILWWHMFYRVVAQQLVIGLGEDDPTLGSALPCLYGSSGVCADIIAYGQSMDKITYSPFYFWLGIGFIGVGLVLWILAKRHSGP